MIDFSTYLASEPLSFKFALDVFMQEAQDLFTFLQKTYQSHSASGEVHVGPREM
jgi:hypothetical protein